MNARYYYDQMQTKYGFDDGEGVPIEAEAVRDLLCAAINAAQSEVKAIKFDRIGAHNWCLMLFEDNGGFLEAEPPTNIDKILEAIDEASLLDDLVCVEARLSPDTDSRIRQFVEGFAARAGGTCDQV